MSRKQTAFLVGGALSLLLLGSLGGAAIYANFFTPRYVYLQPESVPASFSHFTDHENIDPQPPAAEERAQDAEMKSEAPGGMTSFVVAAQKTRPAVVHIKSRFDARQAGRNPDFFSNPFKDFFDEDMGEAPQSLASGSGVLISEDGYVVTNNHVVQNAVAVEVILFDNRTFEAKVIGTDLSTDLALLKIEGQSLPFLSFGDSDQVQVGQWVLAVGNPMDLTSTVTAGIVSAKGRNINLLRADSEFAIESFIQTDAAVNKGNSGGALVDIKGDLIGINTAIASRTGYYSGYSFAIPASIARKVMEDLLSFGEVRRGFLGVSIQAVNAELADRMDLSVLKGAYVSGVNDALGAAEAGIRQGDVIVSVNNVPVNSSSELQEQVSRYRPGDQVRVLAFRGKQERLFNVLLKPINGSLKTADRKGSTEFKGSRFRLLTENEYRKFDVDAGVMVDLAGEKMSEGGIQNGFVITEVDGQKIRSIEQLEEILGKADEYLTIKGLYSKGMIASYSFSW